MLSVPTMTYDYCFNICRRLTAVFFYTFKTVGFIFIFPCPMTLMMFQVSALIFCSRTLELETWWLQLSLVHLGIFFSPDHMLFWLYCTQVVVVVWWW